MNNWSGYGRGNAVVGSNDAKRAQEVRDRETGEAKAKNALARNNRHNTDLAKKYGIPE